jgi:hypothetical protein
MRSGRLSALVGVPCVHVPEQKSQEIAHRLRLEDHRVVPGIDRPGILGDPRRVQCHVGDRFGVKGGGGLMAFSHILAPPTWMPLKRAKLAPWDMYMTCIGSPFPQFMAPCCFQ